MPSESVSVATFRPVWLPAAEIVNHPNQHTTSPDSNTRCVVHIDSFKNQERRLATYNPEDGWVVEGFDADHQPRVVEFFSFEHWTRPCRNRADLPAYPAQHHWGIMPQRDVSTEGTFTRCDIGEAQTFAVYSGTNIHSGRSGWAVVHDAPTYMDAMTWALAQGYTDTRQKTATRIANGLGL